MDDGNGIPIGCVIAGANRNDSPLLALTLEKLSRFGFHLPAQITVHVDAGYDSSKTRELIEILGCDHVISTKGKPLQAGARWAVERTNTWRLWLPDLLCIRPPVSSGFHPGRQGFSIALLRAFWIRAPSRMKNRPMCGWGSQSTNTWARHAVSPGGARASGRAVSQCSATAGRGYSPR